MPTPLLLLFLAAAAAAWWWWPPVAHAVKLDPGRYGRCWRECADFVLCYWRDVQCVCSRALFDQCMNQCPYGGAPKPVMAELCLNASLLDGVAGPLGAATPAISWSLSSLLVSAVLLGVAGAAVDRLW